MTQIVFVFDLQIVSVFENRIEFEVRFNKLAQIDWDRSVLCAMLRMTALRIVKYPNGHSATDH
jgi:hypothetical protein